MVAFTFSRNRCNDNADKLSSLDLTGTKEKHEIRIFIQKCISRLKDQDKQLPQVRKFGMIYFPLYVRENIAELIDKINVCSVSELVSLYIKKLVNFCAKQHPLTVF